MVLPEPARLSVRALAALLRTERIGDPHPVLAGSAMWYPPDESDERNALARKEITALGWYDRNARLEVEVTATLPILCRAETEFFGWITHDGTTIGVLAAAIGRHALLALRDGDSVWLSQTRRSQLAEALADQTPDVPPGQGKPVTLSHVDVSGSGQRLTEAAVRVAPATVAARRVRQLRALPTTGHGELYTAARDDVGRYRISRPVAYTDTSQGRYLNLTEDAGELLVAPASRADLVARLRGRLRPGHGSP